MSTAVGTRLARRFAPGWPSLAVGDVGSILLFLLSGLLQHNSLARLADLGYVADTAAPFLLGWLVAAPMVGAYAVSGADARASVLRAVGAWIPAALVGQALRTTALFHGGTSPAFVAVSLVVGGGLLGVWRAAYALVGSMRAK